MKEVLTIYAVGFFAGVYFGALLMGQLVGWWARRNGVTYVVNHLEITKP
jgi:hypothetical protein